MEEYEDVEEYFRRDDVDLEDKFKFQYEKIMAQLHEDMTTLFKRFPNARKFHINYDYDWTLPCTGSISNDDNGWYDSIIKTTKAKLVALQKGDEQ